MSHVKKQTVLTKEGLANLEKELEQLKTVRRKEVADKIKVALSFGDLSENSEYDEAKNEQAMIESRIAQVEAMLKNVRLVDENELNTDEVCIGSRVKVKELEEDEVCEYYIVGSTETDPTNGKISDESPVGKALIGRCVGDTIPVETPGGLLQFELLEILK